EELFEDLPLSRGERRARRDEVDEARVDRDRRGQGRGKGGEKLVDAEGRERDRAGQREDRLQRRILRIHKRIILSGISRRLASMKTLKILFLSLLALAAGPA